jgi:hypothetical protein
MVIRHNLTIRHPNKDLRANFGLKSMKDGYQDSYSSRQGKFKNGTNKIVYYLNFHFSDIVVT